MPLLKEVFLIKENGEGTAALRLLGDRGRGLIENDAMDALEKIASLLDGLPEGEPDSFHAVEAFKKLVTAIGKVSAAS